MFFEKDVFSFHLLDVMELNQRNVNLFNSKRDFCALSFRFDADAYLKTEAGSLHAVKNAVCFVPERVDYTRTAVRDELVAIHLRTANYAAKRMRTDSAATWGTACRMISGRKDGAGYARSNPMPF